MPRLDNETWREIRVARENGESFRALAARFDISKTSILKRAHKEGWGDGLDVADIIRRRAQSKATGTDTIEEASDKAADILRKHQHETQFVREMLHAGIDKHRRAETIEDKRIAFEDLKAAKISSETIINLHRAERQAWNLDSSAPGEIIIRNPRSSLPGL
jgi:hypothetical protein